jgi:hypothetical protein
MKFREFIEQQKFCKNINCWLDMTFGKKQQSIDDMNVFFSFATQNYYEKLRESDISRMALKSAFEFYQLPQQLFYTNHKAFGTKNQIDKSDKGEGRNSNQEVPLEQVNKEEIKIIKDLLVMKAIFKKDNNFKNMTILTGILKNIEENFYLIWKINKLMPLLTIEKNKMDRSGLNLKDRVVLEVNIVNNLF